MLLYTHITTIIAIIYSHNHYNAIIYLHYYYKCCYILALVL